MKAPIMMTEDYWANSQMSIARYYGGINFQGKDYRIVNKRGIDLFSLSDPQSPYYVGEDVMAIPPGEPADLVQLEWIPIYKALGRENFIKLIQEHKDLTLDVAKKMIKQCK